MRGYVSKRSRSDAWGRLGDQAIKPTTELESVSDSSLVFFISIFSSRVMVMRTHKGGGGGAQRGLDEYIEDGSIEYSIYIPLI